MRKNDVSKDVILDLIQKNRIYQIIAFDSAKRIALLELLYENKEKPYLVVTNFRFECVEGECQEIWDDRLVFEFKKDAYEFYDSMWLSLGIAVMEEDE